MIDGMASFVLHSMLGILQIWAVKGDAKRRFGIRLVPLKWIAKSGNTFLFCPALGKERTVIVKRGVFFLADSILSFAFYIEEVFVFFVYQSE